MTSYQISGPARVCALSQRELKPGERIYSVLSDRAGQLVREDFAADSWKGPPENVVAFWASRIPSIDRPVQPTINEELLLDCFRHLSEPRDDQQRNFRYVVTLLLMRKKRLKFDDLLKRGALEFLLVRDAKTNERYEVLDPRLGDAQMDAVQNEVFALLGWH
jgi:hypothetical protein